MARAGFISIETQYTYIFFQRTLGSRWLLKNMKTKTDLYPTEIFSLSPSSEFYYSDSRSKLCAWYFHEVTRLFIL